MGPDLTAASAPSSADEQVARRDTGSSMVEIIIAVVIIGTLFTGLLGAVQTSIRASSVAFDVAEVETVLLNAADRIARAPQQCDYQQYVEAAAIAEGWSPDTISVVGEQLVANTGAATDWEPENCPRSVSAFQVQRLTISATHPTGEITRTRVVVKSDVE